jgi:hypothetical protein
MFETILSAISAGLGAWGEFQRRKRRAAERKAARLAVELEAISKGWSPARLHSELRSRGLVDG